MALFLVLWLNRAMQHLLSFWYGQSPSWVYNRFLQTIRTLDGHLAVREMVHNITRPLFQDYGWQGRLIGLLLRSARIIFSVFLYFLTFLVYLGAYAVWLLFPIICLVSLVGSFLGGTA